MEKKMIPVIGVPPTPPTSSLQTFPDKNAPKPPKNAARIKNPAMTPNPPKKKLRDAKSQTRRLMKNVNKVKELAKKPLMRKIKMSELIQATGLPAMENGPYVLAEEAKLTAVEKMAQNHWVELNVLLDPAATRKQQKKQGFKMRLIWLLNKTAMLNATNMKAMEQKVADEQNALQLKAEKKKATREARKELKKLYKLSNVENPAEKQIIVNTKSIKEKDTIRVDLSHLTPEKPVVKMQKLMDVEVPKPRSGLTEQLRDFYEKNSMRKDSGRQETGGGGYQYLNEDWYNADKPWRKFQTGNLQNPSSFSSSEFYTSSASSDPTMMAQWGQMAPTSSIDPYGSLTTSSSYSGFSIPQQSTGFVTDFTSPPPTLSSFKDSLAQMLASRQAPHTPDTPPGDALAPGVSPGYISQYRQAFPVDSQYSIPQPHAIQPSPYSPGVQQALEVSEEELARQKRLLEIEEELRMINARKIQMQMEEEIRQREFDLALQTQRMQERERRMREREESSSHRRRHDERGSSRDHHDDYYRRRSPQSSSSSSHYSDRHQYSNSSSSSNRAHHQISIEHEGGGGGSGRRYGGQLLLSQQNKTRGDAVLPRDGGGGQECFQSSSLKRQADHGYDYEEYDDGGHQDGTRPAKRNRRGKHRKRVQEELQMQAISDDED